MAKSIPDLLTHAGVARELRAFFGNTTFARGMAIHRSDGAVQLLSAGEIEPGEYVVQGKVQGSAPHTTLQLHVLHKPALRKSAAPQELVARLLTRLHLPLHKCTTAFRAGGGACETLLQPGHMFPSRSP